MPCGLTMVKMQLLPAFVAEVNALAVVARQAAQEELQHFREIVLDYCRQTQRWPELKMKSARLSTLPSVEGQQVDFDPIIGVFDAIYCVLFEM
jgi:hypothetical protein